MMTGTVCFLMRGKAASAYRVYPTRFCADISAMRCFRQIRRWKRRYSERTLTGAFPTALPLSSVATGKSIVRNAPVSHTKDSRQSTQEKSAQNRKIEGKKSLIQADFQPSHFEGQGVDTFSLFFYFKASTGAWKGGFLCRILRQGI